MNTTFTSTGAVRSRDGFAKFTSSALTNRADSLVAFYKSDGTKQIICGCGTRLEAISTAGAVVASATGLAGGPYSFARIGTPNSELLYAGNGTDTLRKWDGAAWTAPTGTVNGVASSALPKAGLLTIGLTDNRLWATGFKTTTGGPAGATSSPSHVYFSNPGSPETWETGTAGFSNNFDILDPGDGESITGICAWRELIFVFKETKFFVYSAMGTDTAGNPVPSRRAIRTGGVGLVSPRALVAADDGVYFMDRSGLYRTQGQAPTLISSALDPIFLGGQSAFYLGGVLNHAAITNAAMTYSNKQIHLAIPTGTSGNDLMLVTDPRFGWWTLYSIPAAAMTPFRIGAQAELVFAYASGTNDLGRHSAAYTDDAGSPINSHWSGGWFNMSVPNVKTIRKWSAWGKGQVFAGMGYDYLSPDQSTLLDFGGSVNLWGDGSGPDEWGDGGSGSSLWGLGASLTEAFVQRATRGHVFSVQFSSYNGAPWEVENVALYARGVSRDFEVA